MEEKLAEASADVSLFAAMAWAWAVTFLPRLGGAIVILIVGIVLARLAARVVRATLERTGHFDLTVEPVLATAARYAVLRLVTKSPISFTLPRMTGVSIVSPARNGRR